MCFIPTRRVQNNPADFSRWGSPRLLPRAPLHTLAPLLWLLSCQELNPTPPRVGAQSSGAQAPAPSQRAQGDTSGPSPPWLKRGQRGGGPTRPREGGGGALASLNGAPASATPAAPLEVRALLIAEAVRRRTPVGVATRFPNTIGHLWGLVELHNPLAVRQIRLRWRYKGELRGDFPFAVGRGLKWREWSRVLISPDDLGEWTIELYDVERGEVSAVSAFEIYAQGELASGERGGADAASGGVEPPEGLGASTVQQSAVERLVVAAGVKHRLPVGIEQRFSDVERVWGYLEVRHSGPPTDLWMEWLHEGEMRSRLLVNVVESEHWRTWSWQRLRPQRDGGRWEVRVTTASGEVLASAPFLVDEPMPPR
jgi:hypothetical protein